MDKKQLLQLITERFRETTDFMEVFDEETHALTYDGPEYELLALKLDKDNGIFTLVFTDLSDTEHEPDPILESFSTKSETAQLLPDNLKKLFGMPTGISVQ